MEKRKANTLTTLNGCNGCSHLCKYSGNVGTPGYYLGSYDRMPYGCNSSFLSFIPPGEKLGVTTDED
jgi:hypothetical protein